MLLKNKNAVIYGAGGSLGGAFARAFADAGAAVYITGHRIESVQQLANEINAAGGKAFAAEVDAMNEEQVNQYLTGLIAEGHSIDISFNAIGWKDVQNFPLTEMQLADFLRPVNISTQTNFITSTAAGRIMSKQGTGVILSLTATPGGIGYPNTGGFGVACCAVESFSRNLAAELGVYGVRVVNIRSGGSPDSKVFKEAIDAGGELVPEFLKKLRDDTMLKKLPLMKDVANTAVFLASNMAATITGCTIDVTAGTTAAINYDVTQIAFLKERNNNV